MTLDELISELDSVKSALCDAEFASEDREQQVDLALDDLQDVIKRARETDWT